MPSPAFGGAGGQHACMIADTLGIENRAASTRSPGILSAYGMGLADVRTSRDRCRSKSRSRHESAGTKLGRITSMPLAQLNRPPTSQRQGIADRRNRAPGTHVHLRYDGNRHGSLLVAPQWGRDRNAENRFEDASPGKQFGFTAPGKTVHRHRSHDRSKAMGGGASG